MTSLQGAIKWSHEGLCSDKILIFILVKEIVLGLCCIHISSQLKPL